MGWLLVCNMYWFIAAKDISLTHVGAECVVEHVQQSMPKAGWQVPVVRLPWRCKPALSRVLRLRWRAKLA
jgi:hypothetical protein